MSPVLPTPRWHVGSKRFTESYILGELLTQTAARAGPAEHRQGLGNTAIVLAALQAGSIDVYPEYLGTIDQEILKNTRASTLGEMRAQLAPLGLGVGIPLGFNNTYALAVRADQSGVARLSDLTAHPGLKFGLSHEFIGRADGWPGLAARYGLAQAPRGLDHGIAYEALHARQVDVIDIYSTDAKIAQYKLRVLDDDLKYFPRYDAVLLYRLDLPQRLPAAWQALQGLQGSITNAAQMIAMNAAVEIDKKSFCGGGGRMAAQDAGDVGHAGAGGDWRRQGSTLLRKMFDDKLWQLTREHLFLVDRCRSCLACLVPACRWASLAAYRPALAPAGAGA